MPNDTEQLIVRLEAKVAEFEKNMARAERSGTKSFQRLRKESKTATGNMEADMRASTASMANALSGFSSKIGGMTRGGGVFAAIAVALGVAFTATKEAAAGIAEVGDQARIAGVGFEAFQELKYVAEQNRIGVDSLTDGLKELSLRADEFVTTGKGSAAEAFQRLGYGAEELKKKLQDPSALFVEIIDRLGELDRAAQIRVADEIFGGNGGEKFVKLIEQGRDGIEDTIKQARSLGVVMDEQLLKKAERLDGFFKAAATTTGVWLKSAIVSAADSLAEFIDGFREFESQQTTTIQNSINDAIRRKSDIGAQIRKLETEGLEEHGKAYVDAAVAKLKSQIEDINKSEDELITELQKRSEVETMKRTASREWTAPATTPPPPGSSSRSTSTSDIEREKQAVVDLISKLQMEQQQVGMTSLEIAKMNALRDAGAASTQTQRDQIVAIIEATERQRLAFEATRQVMADLKSDTGSFFTTFRQGMVNGEGAAASFRNAVAGMADSIATRLEQLAANKLIDILLGGFTSGLFPAAPFNPAGKVGLFARGTDFAPGGPAIVGERGPELVNLPRGAQVIPNHRIGGAAGKQEVVVTIDMRADGTWTHVVNQRSQAAAAGAVAKHVPGMIADGFGRYRTHVMPGDVKKVMSKPRDKRGPR